MNRQEYSEKYLRRVHAEKRKFFYEKVRDLKTWNLHSIFQVLGWIKEDTVYSVTWSVNILLVIKAYGGIIRKEYGLSYFNQWKRMMYLTFILRHIPKHFLTRLFFKQEKWDQADDYILSHSIAQYRLVDLSSEEEKEIIKNKFNFYKRCKEIGFSTPEVLAVFENGQLTWSSTGIHQPPQTDLFVKNLYGKAGLGIKKFYYKKGYFRDKEGNTYAEETLINYLKTNSKKGSDIILQKTLRNHESWEKFTTGALATCRIVTAIHPDTQKIEPLFCAFKMPVGNSEADNYSLGAIITYVDLKTGKLGPASASKPIDGKFEFTEHPDTKTQIEGATLPFWDDLLAFTLQLHSNFKTIFVGWDVSLTAEGPCVIEGNIGWASGSFEIPYQEPLMKTIYPELYEKWMEKYSIESIS